MRPTPIAIASMFVACASQPAQPTTAPLASGTTIDVQAATEAPAPASVASMDANDASIEDAGAEVDGDCVELACLAFGRIDVAPPLGTASHAHAGARKGPRIRETNVTVSGGLPPEVVIRIVRQHFGAMRVCYMTGLAVNPALSGVVATHFVIANDGSVASANDAGSTMGSTGVVDCVHRIFAALSFPMPASGTVDVMYPIGFSLNP